MSMISKWGTESEEVKQNIFIPSETADRAFNRDIKIIIERIESNIVGKRLLEKIRLCASQIYIFYGKKDKAIWVHDQESKTSSQIPPVIISCSMKNLSCFSTKAESIPFPMHVILFHELTHAYHNLSGKRATSQTTDPIVWESDEEYKTIMGFPSKKKERTKAKITENAFRKVEGLPERFGSWGPSFKDDKLALSAARIKVLGSIHERNQSTSPLSSSPPPIAKCSISDLGSTNRCLISTEVEGVNRDFSANQTAVSHFFWVDPSNTLDSIIGNQCYLRPPSDMTSENIKKAVAAIFPKLNEINFQIRSLIFLRLSQSELDVFLNDIPIIDGYAERDSKN